VTFEVKSQQYTKKLGQRLKNGLFFAIFKNQFIPVSSVIPVLMPKWYCIKATIFDYHLVYACGAGYYGNQAITTKLK
jgi:hypothetical protein